MASEKRLIDANEIIKVAEHAHEQWSLAMVGADDTRKVNEVFKKQYLCKVVKAVAKNCPTVDAVEVVHGRWKKVEVDLGGGIKTHRFACSECDFLKNTLIGNYCPNCGAKMDGGKDNG